MTHAISSIPSTSDSAPPAPPPPPTERVDRLTRIFSNKLEADPADFRRKHIAASDAPAGRDRAELEARRDELHESLRPTPGPVANRSIFLLLVSKRAFGADERETAAMIRFYADALAQEPSWAIERARIRFRDGGWRCPWGGEGWPTEAQVRAECRHETLRIEAELAKIETILGAVPYETGATDSERAGAVAYWEAMKAEIRGEAVIAQRTDAEISAEGAAQKRCDERFRQRERADAAARGRGQAMWGHIRISDELVRQVGLCAPPTDADEDVAFEVGHDRAG